MKKKASALRWGCKPNSVCPRSLARRESFICCSTPETLCPFEPRNGPFLEFPIWPCTGRGLPCLRDCSWSGGLLPHLFTLALTAVYSLWRYPSMRLETHPPHISPAEPKLRGVLPCGVRTFLSRPKPKAILRPTEASRMYTRKRPRPTIRNQQGFTFTPLSLL